MGGHLERAGSSHGGSDTVQASPWVVVVIGGDRLAHSPMVRTAEPDMIACGTVIQGAIFLSCMPQSQDPQQYP